MRLLRKFFLLLTLLAGCFLIVMGWGTSHERPDKILQLPDDVQVSYGNLAIGFYAIGALLLLAALLPMFSLVAGKLKRRRPAKPAAAKEPHISRPAPVAPPKNSFGRKKEAGAAGNKIATARSARKKPAVIEDIPLPPLPDMPDIVNEADLELSEEMRAKMSLLVSMSQHEISKNEVTKLLSEYYPNLIWIINHIHDEQSMKTLGLHLIAIGRFRIKLSDSKLSDNQFSIFQKKIFEQESHGVLRIYLPPNRTSLNSNQLKNYGRAVDDLIWENVQRQVLGSESDWIDFSIKDGANIQAKFS